MGVNRYACPRGCRGSDAEKQRCPEKAALGMRVSLTATQPEGQDPSGQSGRRLPEAVCS